MKEVRILLADEQERVRYGLRVLLRQQPRWKVIGEAENARDLLALAEVLEPDLVLLDWGLPGMKPEAALASLRGKRRCVPVIVISGQNEVKDAAINAGATAFFSKTNPPDQLMAAIQSMMKLTVNNGNEK